MAPGTKKDPEDLAALSDTLTGSAQTVSQTAGTPAAVAETEEDLEALFDLLTAQGPAAAAASRTTGEDTEEDLEALFDALISTNARQPGDPASAGAPAPLPAERQGGEAAPGADPEVHRRIGSMARVLHDALRELGYDKTLVEAVDALPTARQGLDYIITMTQEAADKTLAAVERISPVQERQAQAAAALSGRWQQVWERRLDTDGFRQVVLDTQAYLAQVPQQTQATSALLTEIMEAQGYQDLTGQVIKRLLATAQSLERDLLQLLLATSPEDKKGRMDPGLLNGPAVGPSQGSTLDQAQVDALLENMGF